MNKTLISFLVVGMTAIVGVALATSWDIGSGTDTAKIVGAGTGNATLTVDAVVATTIAGAVTATGGFSGSVTNASTLGTNVVTYVGGICTGVVVTP